MIEHSHGRSGVPVFGWPRVDGRFRFRRPIVYGDQVTVELSVAELGTKSIAYSARVMLAGGEVAAEGKLVNACVGPGGENRMKAMNIPETLRKILNEHLLTD